MSRIGKQPIPIPQGVKIQIDGLTVRAEGPKGKLSQPVPTGLTTRVADGTIVIERAGDDRRVRALHGLARALVANMVTGVKDGFERKLDIVGIGYRAQMQGKNIQLALGYSHPIIFPLPDGVTAEIDKQVAITLRGADKAVLGADGGQAAGAAQARSVQGQGHQVRGRSHPAQGRQEGGREMITKDRRAPRDKRHYRLRRWVRGTAARPRLAVFRSLNHIYAQVVDDDTGRTLVAADSRSKEFRAGQPQGRQRGRRQSGRIAAGPAGQGGGRRPRGVRPRRVQVPRARQGPGRRGARRRPRVLRRD